ncbi:FtsX-like permease family protein [Mycolicibacterium goodii]|uniref:ABC transporter permease n=1 Tax=Mycolicibacterium goodii TaxID=134601 RepID=A0ABS6HLN0_MYCGD|nr:FtsX-like permease family protein [Mycolicibacterium goodii]MBU8822579.1 ABC transporter permease [Mycolicibacterium goodii]MBU8835148.1 ABC transporter permease [Mycolicibacterium goodii]
MIRKGLAYGWLSARRRIREMVLPVVTTATGSSLVVLVFGMSSGVREQAAVIGHADEINRAVILIAVTVLLVGVVEVAVATTRTVAHRTRELGVLGANGIPRGPVVAALLVEPVVAAVVGAWAGAVLASLTAAVIAIAGFAPTGVSITGILVGCSIAIAVSVVAAVTTSFVPTWNAASRPPIRSLTAGG